jgi:hypothetical protein
MQHARVLVDTILLLNFVLGHLDERIVCQTDGS